MSIENDRNFHVMKLFTMLYNSFMQTVDKNKISKRAGIIGIVVNICLCSLKLFLGFITNSIALITDGFNNLTDIANAILVFVGYHLANKPADKKHPYGHGRIEYMLSQAISIMIIIVGFTLLKTSIDRLLNPQDIIRNNYVLIVLIISLIVKLALANYYNKLYLETSLEPLYAQKIDSLADSASITVIIIGYIIIPFTKLPIDSIIGVIVSLLIIYSGINIFIQMTSILLGRPTDEELDDKIIELISKHKDVLGVHDLLIHSYGSDRIYATADVELPDSLSLVDAHNIIDKLEQDIFEQYNVEATLHIDPVVDNSKMKKYQDMIQKSLDELESNLKYHDFHYNSSTKQYYVDVEVPSDCQIDDQEICDSISSLFKKENIVIKIDKTFE